MTDSLNHVMRKLKCDFFPSRAGRVWEWELIGFADFPTIAEARDGKYFEHPYVVRVDGVNPSTKPEFMIFRSKSTSFEHFIITDGLNWWDTYDVYDDDKLHIAENTALTLLKGDLDNMKLEIR